jgi:H+-transporting ATPase
MLAFLSRFWGPMPWLLELTMVLSHFLGHFLEAGVILLLLCVNAGIGTWNERNSRKALELLKRQLKIQTNVRRGGRWLKVPSADLAPGDVVGVGMGGLVPADLRGCLKS